MVGKSCLVIGSGKHVASSMMIRTSLPPTQKCKPNPGSRLHTRTATEVFGSLLASVEMVMGG